MRLRQIHDQIMVLRGAAFNGMIGFTLCVFAWGARLRREKNGSWLHLALIPAPALYFAVGLVATIHHYSEGVPADPPYMECLLLLLAVAGAWLVWKPQSSPKAEEARAKETVTGKETGKKCFWQNEHWARLVLLSAILTAAAVLGWWSTEVFYSQQVLYSYDSQVAAATQK